MGQDADHPSATDKPSPDTSSPPQTIPFWWTHAQRWFLVVGIFLLLAFLTVQRLRRPLYISDPQPDRPARYDELADRIDPNTADVATLSALPMIGPKRAADIVRYREEFLVEHPGGIAFERPEDLLRIKGIGGAMLASLRPYLLLPEDRPGAASQPIIDRP